MQKILIGIPAYNDYDLIHTINCLVNNSKNPERLTISLFLQYDENLFEEYFETKIENIRNILPKNDIVKYIIMLASTKDPIGVCVARYNIFNQITNEEYFLSVDAHTCAKKYWDEILINDLNELIEQKNNKKIIISSNNHMWNPDKDGINLITKNKYCGYTGLKPIEFKSEYGKFETMNGSFDSMMKPGQYKVTNNVFKYELVNHIVCLFAFGPSSWIKEVGWSTNYKFYGEEPDISIRSFCYGWDTYSTLYDVIIASVQSFIGNSKPLSNISNRNYNSQEIVKLWMTGKNNFIDLTQTERSYIDYLKFHNFFNEVVGEHIDTIDPNTLIDRYIFI